MSTIRRVHRPADNFTIIANDAVRDDRLSWAARGILAYLLSHEQGWETSERDLADKSSAGRFAVRTALAELETHGYLSRTQTRDLSGKVSAAEYHVSDCPSCSNDPGFGYPTAGEPTSGDQTTSEDYVPEDHPPEDKPLAPDGASNGSKKKRDHIFETLVDVCGYRLDELTKTARGRLNAAAKELREIGASPDGVRARAGVYRRRWPDIDLTPQGLVANYPQLGAVNTKTTTQVRLCNVCGHPTDFSAHLEECDAR